MKMRVLIEQEEQRRLLARRPTQASAVYQGERRLCMGMAAPIALAFILVALAATWTTGCSGKQQGDQEETVEGPLESFMDWEAAAMHMHLICRGVAYELNYSEDCTFVGIKDKYGRVEWVVGAIYRARGEVTNDASEMSRAHYHPRPVKRLQTTSMEYVKPPDPEQP